MLASTSAIRKAKMILFVLLGWHFFVGNFLLGVLMIAYAYLLTSLWFPQKLAEKARQHAEDQQKEAMQPWS